MANAGAVVAIGLLLPLLLLCKADDPVPASTFGRYSIASGSVLDLEDSPGDIGFGAPIERAQLAITYLSDAVVRVRITDADHARWEVPGVLQGLPESPVPSSQALLSVHINYGDDFQLSVKRKGSPDVPLFEGRDLVFQDRYLRWQTSLPKNPALFGLGERITSLKLPYGQTWSFMASDQVRISQKV